MLVSILPKNEGPKELGIEFPGDVNTYQAYQVLGFDKGNLLYIEYKAC
jgi:hypothetical protein